MRSFPIVAVIALGASFAASACTRSQHSGATAAEPQVIGVGSQAPALVRVDHRGEVVSLRNGAPTLVFFYPKDGTPGCTKEACGFRDSYDRYKAENLRLIGVSSDDDVAHRKFAEEHALPFALIADAEHVWSKAFGVGTFAGLDARISFLIDAAGKVVRVYDDVDPGVHADQVIRDAAALGLVTH
jgi:peroxiredoxin Q/BCP